MERPGRWATGSLVHETLEPNSDSRIETGTAYLGLNVARMLGVHGAMRVLANIECQDEIYERGPRRTGRASPQQVIRGDAFGMKKKWCEK